MRLKTSFRMPALGAIAASLVAVTPAEAAPPTKDECVETHGRAQDHREKGQMADAKRLFLLCAQQSCPALIQSDCAKFGEELARSVPSVSFSARDPKGNDLPDTQVFVDGTLVTSRLDDGKAHDVDPGKHTVRFVRNGKEATVTVVIAVGEKGRNISATLGEPHVSTPPEAEKTTEVDRATPADEPSRPTLPLVLAGVGGAALVTGITLGLVGLAQVPDACTTSPRECTAPPGDEVFDEASSAMNLANVGLGVGIAGLVVGVSSLVWYLSSSPSSGREQSSIAARLAPRASGRGGALRLTF